jgi:hypothetical protein
MLTCTLVVISQLAKVEKSINQLRDFDETLGSQHHQMLKSITDFKKPS